MQEKSYIGLESNEIIDQKELEAICKEFVAKTLISGIIVFNDDGFQIYSYLSPNENIQKYDVLSFDDFSAIALNIFEMAKTLVEISYPSNVMNELEMFLDSYSEKIKFEIKLFRIVKDFNVSIIYSSNSNKGLIDLEKKRLKQKLIKKYL